MAAITLGARGFSCAVSGVGHVSWTVKYFCLPRATKTSGTQGRRRQPQAWKHETAMLTKLKGIMRYTSNPGSKRSNVYPVLFAKYHSQGNGTVRISEWEQATQAKQHSFNPRVGPSTCVLQTQEVLRRNKNLWYNSTLRRPWPIARLML